MSSKTPSETQLPPKETATETKVAVQRIKKAVSDSVDDMASENAGTKAAYVPPGWARKSNKG